MARLSAGEILDELLTYEAMCDISEGEDGGPPMPMNQPYNPPVWKWRRWRSRFDKYRQVVYKGPITLCCYCCWMNTSSGETLEGYQMASFLARDTSLRCARDGDGDWYVYGTFEAPGEDGFFTVQTFIETLDKFDHSTRDREDDICLNFSRPNDRKHLLIDALTGEEVVAFEISHST